MNATVAFSIILIGLSSLLLLRMAYYRLLLQSVSTVVFGALSAYGLVTIITVETLTNQFGTDTYFIGALVYLVGGLSLSIGSSIAPAKIQVPNTLGAAWELKEFKMHTDYSIFIGLISLLLLIYTRNDLLANWNEVRGESGYVTALATFCFLLASPGVVSAIIAKSAFKATTLILICCSIFVLSGSRAAVLCALAFGFWILILRTNNIGKRLKIITSVVILGFAMHVLLRQIRGLGIVGLMEAYSNDALIASFFDTGLDLDLTGGEGAIPKYFLFAIQASNTTDFGFMTSVARVFLLPLPRIVDWLEKPIDVTYLLWGKAYESGLFSESEGQNILLDSYLSGSLGSLHATLFGEYYLAGGWPSLIASCLIMGLILSAIDLGLSKMNRLTALALSGPTIVGYLFVARGNSVIGLGYFFYLGIAFGSLRSLLALLRFSVLKPPGYLSNPNP